MRGKCYYCPYALPHDKEARIGWAPASKGTRLYKAQVEAYDKGGYVCTGDFSVHLPSEEGRYVDCPIYKEGIKLFGR